MKVTTLICPQCGANLESNQAQCNHCGTSVFLSDDSGEFISLDTICPNCGRKNSTDDKHCGNCGQKLVVSCPNSNCLQVNSVWRKFCKKCGVNIIEYRVHTAYDNQARFGKKIAEHEAAVKQLQNTIPASKMREKSVKAAIFLVGAIVVYALLVENSLIWAGIIAMITGIWGLAYESSEVSNLESSLHLHLADLQRLKEKGKINQVELSALSTPNTEAS